MNVLIKCAVLVCNEGKDNTLQFKWKWREEKLPIVDQLYRYVRGDTGMIPPSFDFNFADPHGIMLIQSKEV